MLSSNRGKGSMQMSNIKSEKFPLNLYTESTTAQVKLKNSKLHVYGTDHNQVSSTMNNLERLPGMQKKVCTFSIKV